MSAAMPAQMHLGVDASSTTPTEEYEFELVGLRMAEELFEFAGLRGSRSHVSERVRQNTRAPGLSFRITPNSVELDAWLPRILGGAEATDVFPLAETLPTFTLNLDVVTKRLHFTGCKVNVGTFEAVAGGPLSLLLDVEALDVAVSATAFPSLTISTVAPYIFSDTASGLVVNAQTLQFFRHLLRIDNQLDTGRFLNSQTRVSLPERDRIITWEWDGPYGDNEALSGLAAAGVASTATYTNGSRSVLFSSNKVAYPRELPQVNGREEIRLPLVGVARMDGSTRELIVTNDSV
jgi:hypothetical protein